MTSHKSSINDYLDSLYVARQEVSGGSMDLAELKSRVEATVDTVF